MFKMKWIRNVYILTNLSGKGTFGNLCPHVKKKGAGYFYSKHSWASTCLSQGIAQRCIHTSSKLNGMDISSVQLAGHATRYKPNWDLHECRVKSNVTSQSPNGIDFLVRYIDTAASLDPEEREKMPVVVATHGSPGSYKDLVLVVEPLIDRGARLILPNMPGFDYTQFVNKSDNIKFTHTTAERLDFLEHFLVAANINQVDFVCGHSAGCYPITVLSSKTTVKAAALVSPAPGHIYPRAAEPWWLTCSVDWMIKTPVTRGFGLWLLGAIGYAVSGIPAKNIDHMVAVLQNATGITFSMITEAADKLAARKFPLVFFYCEKDPLVWNHSSREYAQRYNITQTDTFEEDGTLISRGEPNPDLLAKAVCFNKRSHYPQKDPLLLEIIKQEVVELYVKTIGDR